LTTNAIFIRRTAGVGTLSREMAIDHGVTGPTLRGSGVDHDLRRDGDPLYTRMYEGYDFEIPHAPFADMVGGRVPPTVEVGDNWSRFYVRMLEVRESLRLVRQALDKYEASTGPFRVEHKLTARLPKDECYLETECPRGQMGYYVVCDGSPIPVRVRAKSSCFCNLSVTGPLCEGVLIADVPSILGSLDFVMAEIDR
ncbi:MAG: NADH-quinone oxidoreductase subunit D, partial [Planctomycetota bacterium]